MDDDHEYTALDLQCSGWPTDRQTRKARRSFGEGFTWTCPSCGRVMVLTQGKGDYWYWQPVERIGRGGSEMHLLQDDS